MKRTVFVCLALMILFGLHAGPLAQDDSSAETPDPLEIIKKVDAAVKEIDAVSYSAKSTPTGVAENFVAAAEGEAVVVGWRDDWNQPQKFFVHLTTTQRGTGEPLELTGGGDGDMFFIINHSTKKAYEDMDPAVLGSTGNTLQAFGMQEFVHARPFDDEMNATLKYEGVETVNGVECHKIFVDYGQGSQTSTWFFGTEDYLPRRRVQNFTFGDQGSGSFTIEITRLDVDPEIDDSTFRMKLPEGYEQIDDFAP